MAKVPLSCESCGTRNYNVAKANDERSRLALKKYCPKCNAHTLHKETK
ncbi:50S ribosomal protein L33 [Staphylococcus sp. SQ8-PEA]|uniref:Large ribosomal subunit protein bL33 n=1 Tax=Staphylococcus marylandisciuri TaxID=2981529 RepID=A0ABT2QRS4_9STAP|nr:50S ribosomal protein L33 [Staphylococcus marylandisciuri]MCU5746691.1 50S ribosomal protein L33 [Staphylococcus marylandisciuri]